MSTRRMRGGQGRQGLNDRSNINIFRAAQSTNFDMKPTTTIEKPHPKQNASLRRQTLIVLELVSHLFRFAADVVPGVHHNYSQLCTHLLGVCLRVDEQLTPFKRISGLVRLQKQCRQVR